jgi:ABC-type ATPase involved in cell division
MSANITPMTFDIVPRNGGRYKSIAALSWADIPGFAILTGKNGSGKTQLLEILAYHFSGALPQGMQPPSVLPVEVRITGTTCKPEEIAYVPSAGRFSGGGGSSLATMAQFRQQALQHAQNAHSNRNDISSVIRANRILSRLGGRNPRQINQETLAEVLSDADFVADDIDITVGLAHVFMAHRFKMLEALERNAPGVDKDGKLLGPAPWDIVNEALIVAGFPYEVISPVLTKLLDQYVLKLKDRHSGNEIAALDLSSGEKVLLQLVLWLFTAGNEGQFPKLLLLDEPDAHLHPSMTTQFLDVISEVLVNRHGVRVIMTTHSPSTVALAPEGSVFQLERGAAAVVKVDQRPDIISVLTSGLVTVSRTTKFCFVEDEDDVAFYEAVREVLMDHGPSRDPMALRPSPSIAFIPASIGAGKEKIAGGYTVVVKWVDKLDADPLDRTFFGIVDRDAANVASGRVHVLGRYSFENYLLDPLTLFCLLLEEGIAPPVQDVQISSGDEHLLRLQSDGALQAIACEVAAKMEAAEPGLRTTTTSLVTYTVGRQITVPSWVIDHRGHDLLPIAQKAFGGARIVNPPRLIKALRRGRLVPTELATLLAKIQHV